MNEAQMETKRTTAISLLQNSELFAWMPQADLESIADVTSVKAMEKGDYLFRKGSPSHGLYIVQYGAISLHRSNASGKEYIIHVYRKGDSFAEGTLVSGAEMPADARAIEPSQVLLVQRDGILACLRRQPELALRMLNSVGRHMRTLIGQFEDIMLKDVQTRLANWLIKQCRDPKSDAPERIRLPMTKRVLAGELGTISETFSRTLASFRRRNLIAVEGHTIIVLSPAALGALVEKIYKNDRA